MGRNPLRYRIASVIVQLFGLVFVGPSVPRRPRSPVGPGNCARSGARRPVRRHPRPADRLWTQQFIVSGIRLYGGRDSGITAMLTTPNQAYEGPAEYRNDGPLLDELSDGDRGAASSSVARW
jgi:hypothetical protein